jgi:hypothetical protein
LWMNQDHDGSIGIRHDWLTFGWNKLTTGAE